MGSTLITHEFPGTLTRAQVEDELDRMRDQDAHEKGSSYSGGWNMCPGTLFYDGSRYGLPARHFDSVSEAVDFLSSECQKREAVRVVKATDVQVAPYTLDGEKAYDPSLWDVLGNSPASRLFARPQNGGWKAPLRVVDQATAAEKARAAKMFNEAAGYRATIKAADQAVEGFVRAIKSYAEPWPTNTAEVKTARNRAARADKNWRAAVEQIEQIADAVAKRHAEKTGKARELWVAAGVAAM